MKGIYDKKLMVIKNLSTENFDPGLCWITLEKYDQVD